MRNNLFYGLKFKRTYLHGSKRAENDYLIKIQGVKEDNSDCDWFELKRAIIPHFEDRLHVILTWSEIFKISSLFFLIISILLFKFKLMFFIILGLSLILMIIHRYLVNYEKRLSRSYDMSLSIISYMIETITGLKL